MWAICQLLEAMTHFVENATLNQMFVNIVATQYFFTQKNWKSVVGGCGGGGGGGGVISGGFVSGIFVVWGFCRHLVFFPKHQRLILEDWHNASHLHCNHLFCQKFRSLFVHICVMDADATEDSESLKGQATVNFISWGYHLTLILGRKGERDLTYFKQTLVVFVKWTSIYSVY